MKKMLIGCILLSVSSVFACETPSEMSCAAFSSEKESCFKKDQELAIERSDIIWTAFRKNRELTLEEKLRISEITNERVEIANTLTSIALDGIEYFDANIAEVVNDPNCKNL